MKERSSSSEKDGLLSYDDIADWYDATVGDRGQPTAQVVINPGILRVLGDIGGHRILDLDCGQGYFSRILAGLGACVTDVDKSPKPLEYFEEGWWRSRWTAGVRSNVGGHHRVRNGSLVSMVIAVNEDKEGSGRGVERQRRQVASRPREQS